MLLKDIKIICSCEGKSEEGHFLVVEDDNGKKGDYDYWNYEDGEDTLWLDWVALEEIRKMNFNFPSKKTGLSPAWWLCNYDTEVDASVHYPDGTIDDSPNSAENFLKKILNDEIEVDEPETKLDEKLTPYIATGWTLSDLGASEPIGTTESPATVDYMAARASESANEPTARTRQRLSAADMWGNIFRNASAVPENNSETDQAFRESVGQNPSREEQVLIADPITQESSDALLSRAISILRENNRDVSNLINDTDLEA